MDKILPTINSPEDLRKLKADQLEKLSSEIREFIIDHCSNNPGHFGASLGTVELTIALHFIYNTPYDKLVWDVGHQAYAHKILTGRRLSFSSNRKYKGISGFPKISESEYDAFGVGHASTSISAALGMAVIARLRQEKRNIVAIIGDGSMTGGLAFEGMNNAGWQKTDMLIVFNDNNMAIDPNVGAIKEYFAQVTSSSKYNKLKQNVWDLLGENKLRAAIQHFDNTLKSALIREGNFFEALGFRYFGPIDGHNLELLLQTFQRLKNISGPKLLHIITKKGKGYQPAEQNQTEWHAPGLFNKKTGERINNYDPNKPVRYQDVFGETIIELAEQNDKIVGVTPAMPTGCSLNLMIEKMPERAFDVGIAEGHAVTFSAGMAAMGYIPFCNIYSSFMQRAYDSVIHDVALQNLKVVFCLDRGGLVGEDGPTHHGVFDLAYFNLIPNMVVAAPMNEIELRNMMYTAQLDHQGPFSIRYPRGNGVISDWYQPFEKLQIGKAQILTEGKNLAIISIGHPGNFVAKAIERANSEDFSILHCNIRFLKPIDQDILKQIGEKFKYVITVEDGTISGGLGTIVSDFFATEGYSVKVIKLGVPDKFVEQGSLNELYAECGFDENGIFNTIEAVKNELQNH